MEALLSSRGLSVKSLTLDKHCKSLNDTAELHLGLPIPADNLCRDKSGTCSGKRSRFTLRSMHFFPHRNNLQAEVFLVLAFASTLAVLDPLFFRNQCLCVGVQVSTNTALLVTLTESTGTSNSSFAEFSVVVFNNGKGTAAVLPTGSTVTLYDRGEWLGAATLFPVNGSSLPGASAGELHLAWQPCITNAYL